MKKILLLSVLGAFISTVFPAAEESGNAKAPRRTESDDYGGCTIDSNTTWLPMVHLQIGYAF